VRTIEHLLNIYAEVSDYDAKKLPLYLKDAYDISTLRFADVECLLVKPKIPVNLVTLRKQRQQLKKLTGLECVLYYKKTSPYIKRKLTEEGIPFIIENTDVYLPFMGVVLSGNKERTLPKVHRISFNTQRLLLTALYNHWDTVNVSQAAQKLKVSKMTVSRCFDQIEAVGLPLIRKMEKERLYVWEESPMCLWDLIRPYLRNPVFREYRLDEYLPVKQYLFGGMSALSQYSMLNDNIYPTYAITKQQDKNLSIEQFEQVPENEQPLILLQVMQYTLRFPSEAAVDPVSAYLALDETEQQDSRIKTAFSKIMGEYVYGAGH
jgi:hypothetical protein